MNWQIYFSKATLKKGEDIFYRGDVYGIERKGNDTFKAKICTRKNEYVIISVLPDDEPDTLKPFSARYFARCTCDKNLCEHIAAAFFEIDERFEIDTIRQEMSESNSIVKPFNEPVKIQYFNVKHITDDSIITESKYLKAKQLIEKNTINISDIHSDYTGPVRENTLIVTGQIKGGYYSRISIEMDKDSIRSHMCAGNGCDNGYYYYGNNDNKLCEHEIALLLLIEKYLEENEVGDYTDYTTHVMLQMLHGRSLKDIISDNSDGIDDEEKTDTAKQKFQLITKLEKNADELKACYKIGIDKLYVLKNLTEFIKQYESKGSIKLGSKNMIDFSITEPADDCVECLEYIKSQVKEALIDQRRMEVKARYAYGLPDITLKDGIPLLGEKLDEFYDINEGKSIIFQDRTGLNKETSIKLRSFDPSFSLNLDKLEEKKQFLGITVRGKIPTIISGEKNSYFLTDHHLNRTDKRKTEKMVPFQRFANNGELNLVVGKNSMKDFYRKVLPVLEDAFEVNKLYNDDAGEYSLPEAKFNFYLDAENDEVFCNIESVYGEESFNQLEMMHNETGLDIRNVELEEEVFQEVANYFPYLTKDRNRFCCNREENTIYKILKYGIDRLLLIGDVHATEDFRKIKIKDASKVNVGVSIEGDLLNVDFLSDDFTREELLEIIDSYRKKKKYHRLKNGDYVDIVEDELETLSDIFEELHITPKEFVKGKMKFPKYRALYLDKMLENKENLYINRDKNFKSLVKEFKTVDESDFEVPDSLKNMMRKYQVHGFRWIKTVASYGFGGILADDMGLGKTLQMISVLLSDKEENEKNGCSLIVCPASLVYNWKEEFKKFAPSMKTGLMTGTPGERKKLLADYEKYDAIVTSYDALKRDIDLYEDCDFNYEIIDEAQYIKTHSTAVAKAVKIIKAKHKFALTGTPIENKLSELWSIFDYLMPGYLYSYDIFRKDIELSIVKHQNDDNTRKLKRMVAPFILRRTKAEVLKDLPDKLEEIRYAKFDDTQKKLYDAQLLKLKNMINSEDDAGFKKNKIKVLAELTRIRELCCNPKLLFTDYKGDSAKTTACMELIESAIEGNHKMLVFSQFTSMLEILEKELSERKISYYKITGETKKEKRIEYVNQYNEDETPVFLISLKAGGTGLNLTGADIVIHYDPWWNQAVQNQATDRAHRIGQTKTVSVYKLIAKDTIEEKIVLLQEAKKNLADEILNGENGSIGSLTKEELMELIEVQ